MAYSLQIDLTSAAQKKERDDAPIQTPFEDPDDAVEPASRETVPDSIRQALDSLGWADLMPVQQQALPYLLDGHDVVVHDELLDRTTNGAGYVAEHTLAELRDLDAGTWYGSAWSGTGIPTLGEFLPLLQRSAARALIELKGVWPEEGLAPLAAQIYRHGVQDRVVIGSFEEETLLELWRTAPSLARAAVVRRLPADPVRFAERVGASTVVTSLRSFEVEPHAVDALHDAGITVVVYTLNNPRLWQRAIALGVDAVVTDAPRRHAHWQPSPAEA